MLSTIRQIFDLFEPKERWGLAGLCVVIVVVALVQTVGVASIMPFMSVVANPELIRSNPWMSRAYEFGGFQSTRSFLLFMGVLVLAIMAFSNASAAFQHWLMLRFTWAKQHRFSVRLLDQYLREPYTFYLNQNTSGLAKNILAEIGEVINGVLLPGMQMLAHSVVILSVFTLLMLIDVTVAVAAALLIGGSYGVIFTIVRRKQSRLGTMRRTSNSLRFKTAAEALGSVKETKVLGREAEFVKRFSACDQRYSDANASNAMVADIPRYALETLAFGGIVVIVLYLLGTRDDFGEAVAVMSLYALAGYRLMPALQHVFRGLARARFFLPALEGLHADLNRTTAAGGRRPVLMDRPAQPERSRPLSFKREIVLDGIEYTYPGGETTVLRGITLRIPRNTSVAFVGSTGCGKTTIVDILLGLLDPRHGEIRVDGVEITPENMRAWQKRLGYVPQHMFLSDDTVRKNIAFGVPDEEIDDAAVERAARIADLHDFVSSLPDGYETIVGERGVRLSGGQRQRIGIARALYHDPDVLIMDEATSALDGITEETVIRAIRDLAHQKTIILVAHRLTTVRDCDAIYLFDRGEIVASGTYQDLMHSNLRFRAMARGALDEVAVS